MVEEVIYRYDLKRAPSLGDRVSKIGIGGFFNELVKSGWVKEIDGDIKALRVFSVEYCANAEKGDNYVEWKAISKTQ